MAAVAAQAVPMAQDAAKGGETPAALDNLLLASGSQRLTRRQMRALEGRPVEKAPDKYKPSAPPKRPRGRKRARRSKRTRPQGPVKKRQRTLSAAAKISVPRAEVGHPNPVSMHRRCPQDVRPRAGVSAMQYKTVAPPSKAPRPRWGVATVLQVRDLPLAVATIVEAFPPEERGRCNMWAIQNTLITYAMLTSVYKGPGKVERMLRDVKREVLADPRYRVPFVRMDRLLNHPALQKSQLRLMVPQAVDEARNAGATPRSLNPGDAGLSVLQRVESEAAKRNAAARKAAKPPPAAARPPSAGGGDDPGAGLPPQDAARARNIHDALARLDAHYHSDRECQKRGYRARGEYRRQWTEEEKRRFLLAFNMYGDGVDSNRKIAEFIGGGMWPTHVALYKAEYKKRMREVAMSALAADGGNLGQSVAAAAMAITSTAPPGMDDSPAPPTPVPPTTATAAATTPPSTQ